MKGFRSNIGSERSNIKVKFLRYNDAGENKTLEDLFRDKGLGIKFEYLVLRTPQRNGKVEWKFQSLYG